MSDYHDGTLTIDEAEACIEAAATYEIAACWSPRDRRGYRRVDYVSDVRMTGWVFGGRRQTRETAVALAGEDAVSAAEWIAVEKWLETASRNDADDYGDWAYEQRRDMAAE